MLHGSTRLNAVVSGSAWILLLFHAVESCSRPVKMIGASSRKTFCASFRSWSRLVGSSSTRASLTSLSYVGFDQKAKLRSPGGIDAVVHRPSQSIGSGNVDAWPAFARLQHVGLNTPEVVLLYAAVSRTWRSTLKPTS